MKFYTDLNYFDIENYVFKRKNQGHYRIHHMYFYMCLLPKHLKKSLLERFENYSMYPKWVYSRILNVEETFCHTIEECDYVVLPSDLAVLSISPRKSFFRYEELIKKAILNNKKMLFFYGADDNSEFNISKEYGYVFRNAGFASDHDTNVLGCPTFNLFSYCKTYRKKDLSVAFCGKIDTDSCNEVFDKQKYRGIRKQVYDELFEKKCVEGILRENWLGMVETNYESHQDKHRAEFIRNLENNLYGLCVRGGGNFSFRLGEVFMMGRIPILIDTDCILPFKDYIPYHTNTVYVTKENSNNFTDVYSVIEEYHKSHTEEELIQIQKENFKIWIEYFTPDFAFKNTCKLLKEHSK